MKKSVKTGLTVFAIVLVFTQYLVYLNFKIQEAEKTKIALEEVNHLSDRLKNTLSYGFSATHMLAYLIENHGVPDNFDSIAHGIISHNKYIDALQLTQKGIITHVYPLIGNQAAIGFNILRDSVASIEAFKAIEKRELFYAGPLELKQGGTAIIGRYPIFIDEEFFGFSVVIIKLSTLLQSIGIYKAENHLFNYQLSKSNPLTKEEVFFFGNNTNPRQATASVNVPDGEWKLYVSMNNNLSYYTYIFSIIGFLFSGFIGFLIYQLVEQPDSLRKLIEKRTRQLNKSEKYYKALIENSAEAIVLLNEDGKVLYHSPSTKIVCGCSLDKIEASHFFSLFHPDEFAKNTAAFKRLVKTPNATYQSQHRIKQENKQFTWIEGTYTNLLDEPSVNAVVFNFHDITPLVTSQKSIQHEKALSDSIINSLPGIFYLYDENGRFLRWNNNFELITGYTSKEMKSRHPLDFFEGDEKIALKEKIASVFEKGEDEIEAHFVSKDGKKTPFYFNGKKVLIDRKPHLLGVGIDITEKIIEREKALSAYRDKEETLNRISDAVVSLDHNFNLQFFNEAAAKMYPMNPKRALGKPFKEIYPGLKSSIFFHKIKNAVATMQMIELEDYFELKDMWLSIRIYPSSNGLTIFSRNISDRKKIEQETLRNIGRELHDNIVQVLTGANMYLNNARSKIEPSAQLEEVDQLLKKGIEEIRMLSHDLISPFKDGEKLTDSIEKLLNRTKKISGISIIRNIENLDEDLLTEQTKLCILRISQEQINNIIKHAKASQIIFDLKLDNNKIRLLVKDDGVGFDANHESTGVGIKNMESRVTKLNGRLQVVTSPGKGCSLSASIPINIKLS